MFCCGLLWFVVVVCHCLLWLAVVCCEGRSLQVVILYWTGVRARARYGLVRMGSLRMLVVVSLLFVVGCLCLLWFVAVVVFCCGLPLAACCDVLPCVAVCCGVVLFVGVVVVCCGLQ